MGEFDWTETDSAYVNWEALPEGHPARVVRAFNDAAWSDPIPVSLLASMVTPEVRADWGDFSSAAEFFRQGVGLGLNLRYVEGVRDVVYVKLIKDINVATVVRSEDVAPLAYVTLVWRSELQGWRIHRIGEPAEPNVLPRTSPGEAPEY